MNRPAVILNVDDSAGPRYNKSRILRQAGFAVVEAETGAEAMRYLAENIPQLALLDVQLPDVNGIELCRRIKNDPRTSAIPVVQVSATFVSDHDKEVGLEGGAEVYLTEPLEPQELVTVVQMLLRLKRTENEREEAFKREHQARLQAEEATRLKDEFLANLSHELRTPMHTISAWTHLLRGGRLDDAQRTRALEAIERATHSQAQLIEDLLDISRIVSGKLHIAQEPVELTSSIEAVVESQRPMAQAKGVELFMHPLAESLTVTGDPGRLQQALLNLVSNAVKFTPGGGRIEITAQRVAANVSIAVVDSGEGIDPQFLPHVFERFRQADGTATRKHMGLGLGLSITKQIVELHGGTVHAESAGKGQGAKFTMTLPLAAAARARDPAPSST